MARSTARTERIWAVVRLGVLPSKPAIQTGNSNRGDRPPLSKQHVSIPRSNRQWLPVFKLQSVPGAAGLFLEQNMETATPHSRQVREVANAAPGDFLPLHLETRTHVSTAVLCRHINRQEQTARGWACAGTFPPELAPKRINGRLAWPVAGIRAVLGVA
jgi:hypothetical protein